MRCRYDIENERRSDVEIAIESYKLARKTFAEYVEHIPSGLPAPDGALRIKNAGLEQECAVTVLKTALQRLHDLSVLGETPAEDSP